MVIHVERRFEALPGAVREARQFLQSTFAGVVGPRLGDDLTLVMSELASNAVRHAQTPFSVDIHIDRVVRIEVADGSTDLPTPRPPSGEGGRGLGIVDRLCDRWGSTLGSGSKCVWCERDRQVPDGVA
jgi:anti-sigma regulatory factor (Ser/Thr protein kinase)